MRMGIRRPKIRAPKFRAPKLRESDNQAEKSRLLGLFHLQSTPRKAEIVKWGYNWRTWSGRRDIGATVLLVAILLVCALMVSGFIDSMHIIYIQADFCQGEDGTLGANLVTMREITRYREAREAASSTVNLTATAYYAAETAYNGLDMPYIWPSPYDLSEEERQELELQAREGGDNCETVEKCVGGAIGWIGGVIGTKTCVEADVPCPDIEATALLVEYDSSQNSLDLFGRNTTDKQEYNTTLAQTALDSATDAIKVLVRRVNFASSIYVVYLAFLVVVTPPFVVYGAKWNRRIFDYLANVNKPIWIALAVLVWYAHEAFQAIINSSLYSTIWANFLHDPCWADPEFLVNTSSVIRDTCRTVTSSHNLFSQASANYRYYSEVENTWQSALVGGTDGGPFYGNPAEELLSEFPGNCTPDVLLDAIQPSDGTVSWWSLFFRSGAFVALLLQFVMAHWFISWFNVLRPLTVCRGRFMIPETSQDDVVLYHEVVKFARARAILPFILTTILLILLLVNLGASSSEEGMGKAVLFWALWLFGFQFILVPLLIWRPKEESMLLNVTKKDLENQQQQESVIQCNADGDFPDEPNSEDMEAIHHAPFTGAGPAGAAGERNEAESLDSDFNSTDGNGYLVSAAETAECGENKDDTNDNTTRLSPVRSGGRLSSNESAGGSLSRSNDGSSRSNDRGMKIMSSLRRVSSSLSTRNLMSDEDRELSGRTLGEAVQAALAATNAARAVTLSESSFT